MNICMYSRLTIIREMSKLYNQFETFPRGITVVYSLCQYLIIIIKTLCVDKIIYVMEVCYYDDRYMMHLQYIMR